MPGIRGIIPELQGNVCTSIPLKKIITIVAFPNIIVYFA
jgi:hypothetical protein